ncbi:allene oxide synthase-lipoxygenase protein-like [Asterias amurensis]|uniref:allene oxide synthase-lipoxygenase protein-like n=1 Tax=Asterias amurensis TaxID=7602 RepID=UPI003AB2BAF1
MGNGCVGGTVVRPNGYRITVKTGDHKGSGSDADVFMILIKSNGKRSKQVKVGCRWKDDFEKGSVDHFDIENPEITEEVDKIEIRLGEGSLKQDWFVETIRIKYQDLPEDRSSIFPIHRWIKEGEELMVVKNDSTLPQEDPHKKQRLDELARKKDIYQLEKKFDGQLAIPQVKELPVEQEFSNKYFFDVLAKRTVIYKLDTIAIHLTTDRWTSLDDIINVYNETLPVPYGVKNWRCDKRFAAQRLMGCNPAQIWLCTEIPSNFAVTDDMVKPIMEGMTLKQAIEKKKLFIVNYEILKDLATTDNRLVCAPMALFFVDNTNTLMPVAIQLFQDPSNDNPVFLPTDPEYTWILAKMWFNNADGAYHEAATHLGFTHLLVESTGVAANRCLSPSHPIFKLLAPHYLYLMAIDSLALVSLINPGGSVDENMNIGQVGFISITERVFPTWRLNVEGSLPADLRNRGVEDPDVLPNYYYRDDAILLYEAIMEYVEYVVNKRYHSAELLAGDNEIQEFAETLVRSTDDGGCGIQGVTGNGQFSTNAELIDVLVSIIFAASISHAAVNFNQYDEYGFPPNAPLWMSGQPPTNKTPLTEQDVLDSLPNKERTLGIMTFTALLSERATQRLGNFEKLYQTDPIGGEAVRRFQDKLSSVGDTIRSRDAKRDIHYPYLDPRQIPNAISI